MPPNTWIAPWATSRAARDTYALAIETVRGASAASSSRAAAAYRTEDHELAWRTYMSASRWRSAWKLPIVRPNWRRSAA